MGMADERTDLINAIISPAVELRDAAAGGQDLTQNYKAILNGKDPFVVPEIKPYVSDFQELLKWASSKDAIENLSLVRLRELRESIDRIYTKLAMLHNYELVTDRTNHDQKQQFIQFFQNNTEPSFYWKSRERAWERIIEGITLLNTKRIEGLSGTEHIATTVKNFESSQKIFKDLTQILETAKAESLKGGVSKHAGIFEEQAKTHRNNAILWGVVAVLLLLLNAKLLFYFYEEMKIIEKVNIQLGALVLLIVSLVSYCLVIAFRSYFAEKHNQTINRHKANCLGTYQTFTDSASDEVRSIILQYTTQTIFSQFNPGYLNKDGIQSPSPTIELLRNVINEKKV
jgi:hypothetical protein